MLFANIPVFIIMLFVWVNVKHIHYFKISPGGTLLVHFLGEDPGALCIMTIRPWQLCKIWVPRIYLTGQLDINSVFHISVFSTERKTLLISNCPLRYILGTFIGEFFYQMVGTWCRRMILTIWTFLKLKTTFCKHWLKSKLAWPVSKGYEVTATAKLKLQVTAKNQVFIGL